MKRRSLICRLGRADRARVDVVEGAASAAKLNFLRNDGSLGFGLGNMLDSLGYLGLAPQEAAIDLAILAALVFCADTRISRDAHSQDGWTREIDIYVPVSDPRRWEACASTLVIALNFLTGDRWRVFFRPRPPSAKNLAKPVQRQFHDLTCACLFSGGLDSFIGAVDLIKSGERPLLVGHYADGITSQHQKICQQRLEKKFGTTSWKLVRACVRFGADAVRRGGAENTQRSRSFLFFALGVLGASSLGKPTTLEVPENGLIALNPPLDPLRIGALSTRTTHPFFMRRFEELVAALGINVTLVNQYRHMTKGQMVRKCRDKAFLKAHLKDTMSCSSPTKGRWKKKKPGHCGYCVPCLIRRAAIIAGIGSDDTPYATSDLSAELLDSRTATGTNIRSFLLAARRLKANPVLAKVAIHASGPLREFPDEREAYAKMYADGIGEVAALLKNVTTERP